MNPSFCLELQFYQVTQSYNNLNFSRQRNQVSKILLENDNLWRRFSENCSQLKRMKNRVQK